MQIQLLQTVLRNWNVAINENELVSDTGSMHVGIRKCARYPRIDTSPLDDMDAPKVYMRSDFHKLLHTVSNFSSLGMLRDLVYDETVRE